MAAKTYNHGAADERTAMLRKVQRLIRNPGADPLGTMLKFIQTRKKRYDPKPGGVGK